MCLVCVCVCVWGGGNDWCWKVWWWIESCSVVLVGCRHAAVVRARGHLSSLLPLHYSTPPPPKTHTHSLAPPAPPLLLLLLLPPLLLPPLLLPPLLLPLRRCVWWVTATAPLWPHDWLRATRAAYRAWHCWTQCASGEKGERGRGALVRKGE